RLDEALDHGVQPRAEPAAGDDRRAGHERRVEDLLPGSGALHRRGREAVLDAVLDGRQIRGDDHALVGPDEGTPAQGAVHRALPQRLDGEVEALRVVAYRSVTHFRDLETKRS